MRQFMQRNVILLIAVITRDWKCNTTCVFVRQFRVNWCYNWKRVTRYVRGAIHKFRKNFSCHGSERFLTQDREYSLIGRMSWGNIVRCVRLSGGSLIWSRNVFLLTYWTLYAHGPYATVRHAWIRWFNCESRDEQSRSGRLLCGYTDRRAIIAFN